MSSYKYTARTRNGDVQTGVVEAGSDEAAIRILQEHQLIITRLTLLGERSLGQRVQRSIIQRITRKDMLLFSRQLAILFEAHVPMLEALRALAEQTDNQLLARMIRGIAADIDGGMALSDALEKYPRVFSEFYVSMVRSGEASGKLDEVFSFLAEYLERQYEVLSRIRGAFIYPAFILVVFAIVFGVMVAFVLPTIGDVFSAEGVELPLVTRMLLKFAEFLRATWFLWIFGFLAFGFVILRFVRTPAGRQWFHARLLYLPIAGPLMRSLLLSRFADNLSTLISAGLPILRALEITAAVVGNVVFQEALAETVTAVQRGEKIHTSLRSFEVFPPTVVQMIAVGEQTGKLDVLLKHVAKFYQREIDHATANLISIIEPVIIVVLGIGIAIFIATILLPIYNLSLAFS